MLAAAMAGGCREPLNSLQGATPSADGRGRAQVAIEALAARVSDPVRDQKFDTARTRIAYAALIPSRVWNDTVAWTSVGPRDRFLLIEGRSVGGRYRLDARPVVPPPSRPADSRHEIQLTRVADGEYRWFTDVDYALGSVRAPDVGTTIRLLLTSAEGRAEDEIRRDYRSATPRASRIMGELVRVDSIRTSQLADSSTLMTLAATVTPHGIEERLPNFSKYLKKYVHGARMHWRLADSTGAVYLDFLMRDGTVRIRSRSRDHRLVPISGPSRTMPDTLVLLGDMTVKVRIFTAGFRNYRSAFILSNSPRRTAFTIHAREEPEWILPLVTERLLRTPLRHPFRGDGALFRMGVSDSVGAQTLLFREMRLDVKESAIMRFLTRLTSTAYGDFAGKVEKEENQWFRELLGGLAEDIAAGNKNAADQ